jgi:transcriptional regulator with XRE-family HTH domain
LDVRRLETLSRLARRAGLSQAMISFVEREIQNPSLDTLPRIAEVLELNLDDAIRNARLAALRQKSK